MKRLKLILGLAAVMTAMIAASVVPAMAADNNRHENRVDSRLDRFENRLDNHVDLDGGVLTSNVALNHIFTPNEELANELCGPLSSDAVKDAVPACIFGGRNDDLNISFVSDVNRVSNARLDSGIDNGHFVDVDFDWGIRFANGNNHQPPWPPRRRQPEGRGWPEGTWKVSFQQG